MKYFIFHRTDLFPGRLWPGKNLVPYGQEKLREAMQPVRVGRCGLAGSKPRAKPGLWLIFIIGSGLAGLVREKMSLGQGNSFAEKHKGSITLDPSIKEAVLKRSKEGKLPCAVAFEIAKELGVEAAEVGKTVDLLNFRLMKCQLGLFGYLPEKKIIKPQNTENQDLKDAIFNALVDGRLPCKNAWDIASEFKIRKMTISSIVEAMKIKIKPCQIGAF